MTCRPIPRLEQIEEARRGKAKEKELGIDIMERRHSMNMNWYVWAMPLLLLSHCTAVSLSARYAKPAAMTQKAALSAISGSWGMVLL
jgi:hypothetical protein